MTNSVSNPDYVIIGAGINSLVAAAMLSAKGRKVLVLERADVPGGCMRTDEVTLPGFHHDVMAATFVLFLTSPAYGALGNDLARHGFDLCHSAKPTAVLRPDNSALVLTMDRQANCDAMNALAPARGWLENDFTSPLVQALWAPWALYVGLTPESTYSGQMSKVIAFALEAAGAPVVKGGSGQAAQAFRALIEERGGEIRCNIDVDRIKAILARHIRNFDQIKLARRAYSPPDLAALNPNLVGGDPYGGACSIDQFFIWRPFSHSVNDATGIRNLHHIGASTHPGPGLGGGSGFNLAKRLGA